MLAGYISDHSYRQSDGNLSAIWLFHGLFLLTHLVKSRAAFSKAARLSFRLAQPGVDGSIFGTFLPLQAGQTRPISPTGHIPKKLSFLLFREGGYRS